MPTSKSRQSIGRFAVNIFGALIGAISTIFIYPLDMDLHGLSMFILNTALILAPVFLIGFNGVAINNYQEFRTDDRKDNGFLGFLFIAFFVGCLIYGLLFLLFSNSIGQFFSSNKPEYNTFFNFILPVTLLSAGTTLLDAYLSNFYKITITSFFRENLIKISLPLIIWACYSGWISIPEAMWGIVLTYGIAFTFLLAYTYYLRPQSFHIDLSFLNKDRLKRIFIYGFIASIGAIGSQLVGSLDIIMIKAILPPLELISIFNMHFTMASFVYLPYLALSAIGSPLLAKHIFDKNSKKLQYIYQMTTTIMLVLGTFLFLLAFCNLKDLYSLMKNGDLYAQGWLIFIFLGTARLIDLGTGLNTQLLSFSSYYKVILYTTLGLGAMNFCLNYWLIHTWGINGAAVSSLLSILLYNCFKVWYVYRKFKILPFSSQLWKLILTGLLCLTLLYILPHFHHSILSMIIRSGVISIIFWICILKLHVSQEINHYSALSFQKIMKFIGRK
jgi:O-antigen/teichoic acid export membrane protein